MQNVNTSNVLFMQPASTIFGFILYSNDKKKLFLITRLKSFTKPDSGNNYPQKKRDLFSGITLLYKLFKSLKMLWQAILKLQTFGLI